AGGAGTDDVAVRQEAAVGRRIGLSQGARLDPARRIEAAKDLLRQDVVRFPGSPREMIEREAETPVDVGLNRVLACAVFGDGQSFSTSGQLSRCAVLIGAAEE